MSYRNREKESKLLTDTCDLGTVNRLLSELLGENKTKLLFGSSTDIYWTLAYPDAEADFLRVRERDGCVEVTVKGKDRGTNLDRMEMEYRTTNSLQEVINVHQAALGPPAGTVSKMYYVYWVNKTDTICCYVLMGQDYRNVVVEVEAGTMDRMLALEDKVTAYLVSGGIQVSRAPGSLFEMFITKEKKICP
jgi:hypothetical protein